MEIIDYKEEKLEPVYFLKDGIIIDCSQDSLKFQTLPDKQYLLGSRIEELFPLEQHNGKISIELWNQFVHKSRTDGIQHFPWKFNQNSAGPIAIITLISTPHYEIVIARLDMALEEKWNKVREHQDLLLNINERIEEGIYRSSPKIGLFYANTAFMKMFGFDSEREMPALTLIDLNELYDPLNDRSTFMEKIRVHGSIKNQEILYRKKDGSRFWGLESCFLHEDKNGNEFIDGVIVDISPIKESENLLIAKNIELQKINEELDRFVYSVSHDLRAPLSSLIGLLNLAELEPDPTQLNLFFQMMKKSIWKLNHFINEVLDYSRNARLSIEKEKVDLQVLTMESIADIEYLEGFGRIRKSVKIVNKTEFVSDRKRLLIILTNLVTNSILYYDPHKENRFLEITGLVEKDLARIEVRDNGKGIHPQHLDKIFDMFYRASEDSKGSGLGLFMVKECVEKLEGTINVSSILGNGTKFEIVLKNFVDDLEPKSRFMSIQG